MPGVFKALPLLFTVRGMVRCDWLRADLSHSAEKGDWRLSRFGKKGRKHDRITRRAVCVWRAVPPGMVQKNKKNKKINK